VRHRGGGDGGAARPQAVPVVDEGVVAAVRVGPAPEDRGGQGRHRLSLPSRPRRAAVAGTVAPAAGRVAAAVRAAAGVVAPVAVGAEAAAEAPAGRAAGPAVARAAQVAPV